MGAFRFVAVNRGKYSDPNRRIAALRADKKITRQDIRFAVHLKTGVTIGDDVGRLGGNLLQRRQQISDGSPGRRFETPGLRNGGRPFHTQSIPHKLFLLFSWELPVDRSASVNFLRDDYQPPPGSGLSKRSFSTRSTCARAPTATKPGVFPARGPWSFPLHFSRYCSFERCHNTTYLYYVNRHCYIYVK